ncbi:MULTISPECIES: collagen-like protein [unclassified Pseudomonas]|uniref:collagen-like protein n=1 Tax=unclassified Pseudomonas TaxID=196821 RepID=UPI0025F60F48|nr:MULTISPECIES: collagen-like protein [unclassified Pseudomonas]
MRNALLMTAGLLSALSSSMVIAQSISVQTHSLMRLPNNASVVQLDRLEVADYGTLLIPRGLTEVRVGQLVMGHESRIAIVPSVDSFTLQVKQGDLSSGAEITARGAPGTFEKAPSPGRNLNLRIEALNADELSIDARGGAGSPGYAGLDGGNGQEPGCTWGAASRGFDGDNGGNGHDGAPGAVVRLELPQAFADERVKVNVQGGAGGIGGEGGRGGKGGASKGCLVYHTDGAKSGRNGDKGQSGAVGPAGSVNVRKL